MTGNPELEWMENGLPEMLITDISQSATLRPVLEDRVRRILDDLGKNGQRGFDEETLEVFSRMADADYVLHGGFLESEGRLRVDLVLKESATGVGTPMKLDGKATEVFTLVDSITERLSAELDLDTLFDRNRPVAEVATLSLDAYRAYQQGIDDMHDGRNQAATAALLESVKLDPNFAMAHAKLAQAYWNLGDSESAKASIEIANALALEHALPLSERFQVHAVNARINDDPETAIDAYRKLTEFYPSDPDVMLGLASALESKGEMDQALETYQRVIEGDPTYGAALLGLGRMLVTVDRSPEAIPVLERAVETKEFEDDFERLGMLHSVLGVAYRTSKDYVKALEHFERSLAARRTAGDNRGVIAALVHIGVTRKELRQVEQSSRTLEEAVALARTLQIPTLESFALQNFGNLALEEGRLEDALEYYRASLDIEWDKKENNEIAYRLDAMAEVYQLSGNYIDALVYLEQARSRLQGIDEPSERAFNLSILGQILRARGEYDEAAQALLSAIPPLAESDQTRDLVSARRALADIYMDQGRFDEALVIIRQSLSDFQNEAGTNLATAKLQYAELLLELGDFQSATTELNSINRLVPDLKFESGPYSDYLAGRLLATSGDSRAVDYLSRARDNAKGRNALVSGQASVALARVLLQLRRPEEARQELTSVTLEARRLKHRVVLADALLALAETEMASGDLKAAELKLQEAKAIASDFQGRVLLYRIGTLLSQVAEKLAKQDMVEAEVNQANSLRQWIVSRLPAEYEGSFEERLATNPPKRDQ
jgi:tetratricopeptide (TPR) repeat protein